MSRMFPLLRPLVHPKDDPYRDVALPVLGIPWEVIAPHEEQAQRNHGQTIERLAERGGLSPKEMCAVLSDKPYWGEIEKLTPQQVGSLLKQLVIREQDLINRMRLGSRDANGAPV